MKVLFVIFAICLSSIFSLVGCSKSKSPQAVVALQKKEPKKTTPKDSIDEPSLSAKQEGTTIVIKLGEDIVKKIDQSKLLDFNSFFISYSRDNKMNVLAGKELIVHSCEIPCEVTLSEAFASLSSQKKVISVTSKKIIDKNGSLLASPHIPQKYFKNELLSVDINDHFAMYRALVGKNTHAKIYKTGKGEIAACQDLKCQANISLNFVSLQSLNGSKIIHKDKGTLYECEESCEVEISDMFALALNNKIFDSDGKVMASIEDEKMAFSGMKISDHFASVELREGKGGKLFHKDLGLIKELDEEVEFTLVGNRAIVTTHSSQYSYDQNGKLLDFEFDEEGYFLTKSRLLERLQKSREYYQSEEARKKSRMALIDLRDRIQHELDSTKVFSLNRPRLRKIVDGLNKILSTENGLFIARVEGLKQDVTQAPQKMRESCLKGESDAHYSYAAACVYVLKAEKKFKKNGPFEYPADNYENLRSEVNHSMHIIFDYLIVTTLEEGHHNSISLANQNLLIDKYIELQEKAKSYLNIAIELVKANPGSCKKSCEYINWKLSM